jgi:hypothetical protein
MMLPPVDLIEGLFLLREPKDGDLMSRCPVEPRHADLAAALEPLEGR